MSASERLIVALDCPTVAQSHELVAALGPAVTYYKVGWRTFLSGGLTFVDGLRSQGKRVFLDLKMNDIAETISTAVAELRDRADLLTNGHAGYRAGSGNGPRRRRVSQVPLGDVPVQFGRKRPSSGLPGGGTFRQRDSSRLYSTPRLPGHRRWRGRRHRFRGVGWPNPQGDRLGACSSSPPAFVPPARPRTIRSAQGRRPRRLRTAPT